MLLKLSLHWKLKSNLRRILKWCERDSQTPYREIFRRELGGDAALGSRRSCGGTCACASGDGGREGGREGRGDNADYDTLPSVALAQTTPVVKGDSGR